jgi:hypothetical protein
MMSKTLFTIKTSGMSDNKQNAGTQDRIRIDANDRSEVEYVHQQFPWLKHEEIFKAIKEKGPIRENVIRFLESVKKP